MLANCSEGENVLVSKETGRFRKVPLVDTLTLYLLFKRFEKCTFLTASEPVQLLFYVNHGGYF